MHYAYYLEQRLADVIAEHISSALIAHYKKWDNVHRAIYTIDWRKETVYNIRNKMYDLHKLLGYITPLTAIQDTVAVAKLILTATDAAYRAVLADYTYAATLLPSPPDMTDTKYVYYHTLLYRHLSQATILAIRTMQRYHFDFALADTSHNIFYFNSSKPLPKHFGVPTALVINCAQLGIVGLEITLTAMEDYLSRY